MCGRNFAEDRIEKHEEVCAKTFNKKRKQFDMTKARVKGTDAAKFVMGKGGVAVRQTAPTKERIILIIQIIKKYWIKKIKNIVGPNLRVL